jgi:hypothetical protein
MVVNMPAHVLRAADRLMRLHAPESEAHNAYFGLAQKRFDPVDLAKTYEAKEAWYSLPQGDDWQFTSTACGLRVRVHGDWKTRQLALQNGTCVAYFGTGPYQATVDKLSPGILVMVKRPEPGQSLEDYLKLLTTKYTVQTIAADNCPASRCLAGRVEQADTYGKNGGQAGRILAFERDEPEFPGLAFEAPQSPPVQNDTAGPQAFRPAQSLQRIPGKLYYVVLLDVAASIQEPGLKDYEFVVKNLMAE